MGKYVIEEIIKDLKWHKRIIVKLFRKTFVKIYKIGITYGFNSK